MTIGQVIERVRELRPHAFSQMVILDFINEIEGKVQSEILRLSPQDIIVYTGEDLERELIVVPPHDVMYVAGVKALLARELGEWDEYANLSAIFNDMFEGFLRWHRNTYGFPVSNEE